MLFVILVNFPKLYNFLIAFQVNKVIQILVFKIYIYYILKDFFKEIVIGDIKDIKQNMERNSSFV